MQWREISADPNHPAVLTARREQLGRVKAPPIANRVDYLCELARGKRVLDIGVIEHSLDATNSGQWLHGRLCAVAESCVGIDILDEEIRVLVQRGYDIRKVDLTEDVLDETFDVIVMGELIEHVGAPGPLFQHVASMLAKSGVVVLTTPNPWYANVLVKNVFAASPFTDSADHVAWYDASTLWELGQRYGLELSRYAGVKGHSSQSHLGRVFFGLAPLLVTLGTNPLLFSKSIVYEFRHVSEKE